MTDFVVAVLFAFWLLGGGITISYKLDGVQHQIEIFAHDEAAL